MCACDATSLGAMKADSDAPVDLIADKGHVVLKVKTVGYLIGKK